MTPCGHRPLTVVSPAPGHNATYTCTFSSRRSVHKLDVLRFPRGLRRHGPLCHQSPLPARAPSARLAVRSPPSPHVSQTSRHAEAPECTSGYTKPPPHSPGPGVTSSMKATSVKAHFVFCFSSRSAAPSFNRRPFSFFSGPEASSRTPLRPVSGKTEPTCHTALPCPAA